MGNPEIQSAAVNLLTESAVFKVPADADKDALGEQAAHLLTKQVHLLIKTLLHAFPPAVCIQFLHNMHAQYIT